MRWMLIVVSLVTSRAAAADPTLPAAASDPSTPPLLSTLPLLRPPTFNTVPSLRLEAVRVAGERFANDWRYPEPAPLVGIDGGLWFVGQGYYRPRTRRAAALHGASVAATMIGEILLSADSPVAGVGALLTGATLDAATADVDRDAEGLHR